MRILVVAMSNSVHVARWLSQIDDQGWDIHLFPSIDNGRTYPETGHVTVHHSFYAREQNPGQDLRLRGVPVLLPYASIFAAVGRWLLNKLWPGSRAWRLSRLIRRLQPDLIHAIEFQQAGYLVLEVRQAWRGAFPPLMVTNYGSDIYLFGKLAAHREKIRSLLAISDFYACECERDVALAREYGFQEVAMPVLPSSGGFDLGSYTAFRSDKPVSARRLILLKGYQHWAGRALVGLRALALCRDILEDYTIVVCPALSDVALAAEAWSHDTGISVEVYPYGSQERFLRLMGEARVFIGLSISDGISHSLLEAMVMGAFPIQSCTACADEWIVDGESGFIVPPEDPQIIAEAIRRALLDDALVDQAAERNSRVAAERLDRELLKPQIVALYERALGRVHEGA